MKNKHMLFRTKNANSNEKSAKIRIILYSQVENCVKYASPCLYYCVSLL